MPKPILYVKSGCPWCVDALDYFNGKGLDLEVVDLRVNPHRMDELVAASGQTKTPTLKHGDFIVADFDLDEFEAAMEQSPEAKAKLGL